MNSNLKQSQYGREALSYRETSGATHTSQTNRAYPSSFGVTSPVN